MEQSFDRPATARNRLAWNLVEPRLLGSASEGTRRELLSKHASAITGIIMGGFAVELFSTDRADEPFLRELELAVSSPYCRVRPITGLKGLLGLYLEVDIVVASRMHALIVAFTQGAPVLGLSWQQKVGALFDLIDRPGQCLSYLDLDVDTLRALIGEARAYPERFVIREKDRARLVHLNDANLRVMAEFGLSPA
jgi:hypothetical protein